MAKGLSLSELHFDVSTGLKSVLGSELITDDEVAVFELVKNSFDADATRVNLHFGPDRIIVADNGNGMSLADIRGKWLFVAYSSKRQAKRSDDFRNEAAARRQYAGSKGIGRFSSDRLGTLVRLQTRSRLAPDGPVHSVTVDWTLFDADHRKHFESIPASYAIQRKGFELPPDIPGLLHGTAITIERLRRTWDREKILRLKSALAKLINPFGAAVDGFQINIVAPGEMETDNALVASSHDSAEELPPNALVNGEVGNFVFATLREKTTFIEVRIDLPGTEIESSLTDRGELVYRIREPNPYSLLAESRFRCEVYFLNTSAKMTFARRMGVPSVQFGSVFLFRNGFRIYPIGNESDDWYGMDRRKQQGYARFLGSRDVIGRIDVSGAGDAFAEPSSRNTALIETPAVEELRNCFMEHCLKRLERYVVPVTFGDKEDKLTSDTSRLMTDPGSARVAAALARLVDNQDVQLIDYSRTLVHLLDERSSQFEESLLSLRAIAEKTKDSLLFRNLEQAEQRFQELKASEAAARRQADEERSAKEAAQSRASAAESAAARASEQYSEERKRSLFLSSISALDTETILNLHHQVTIYAVDIQQQLENYIVKIAGKESVPTSDVLDVLEGIALLNRKVMGISKFATKANFRLESEMIEADLGDFVEQYINGVACDFLLGTISVVVSNDHKGFQQRFKPIDVSVVVDNLVANARKARANEIVFDISHPNKSSIHLKVTDDGKGFSDRIDDLTRVFEKGFTTTDGSGLGLFHIQHVLGEMNGTIEAVRNSGKPGATFLIRISK